MLTKPSSPGWVRQPSPVVDIRLRSIQNFSAGSGARTHGLLIMEPSPIPLDHEDGHERCNFRILRDVIYKNATPALACRRSWVRIPLPPSTLFAWSMFGKQARSTEFKKISQNRAFALKMSFSTDSIQSIFYGVSCHVEQIDSVPAYNNERKLMVD